MSAIEIPRATWAFKLLSFNCGGSDELVSSSAALKRRRYRSENSVEPYSPSIRFTALLPYWSVRRASCAQSIIKGSYKSERVQRLAFRDQSVMSCKQLRENRDALQSWRRRQFCFPRFQCDRKCSDDIRRRSRATKRGSARYLRRFSLEVPCFSGGTLAGILRSTVEASKKPTPFALQQGAVRCICVDKRTRSIGCCWKSKDMIFTLSKSWGASKSPPPFGS